MKTKVKKKNTYQDKKPRTNQPISSETHTTITTVIHKPPITTKKLLFKE